jgi:hypothetical protein
MKESVLRVFKQNFVDWEWDDMRELDECSIAFHLYEDESVDSFITYRFLDQHYMELLLCATDADSAGIGLNTALLYTIK